MKKLSTDDKNDNNATKIAKQLIEHGDEQFVAGNLYMFFRAGAEIDATKLAKNLIRTKKGNLVTANLQSFLNMGADVNIIVEYLMHYGKESYVANNLNFLLKKGAIINVNMFAAQLMSTKKYICIADNLKSFINAGAKIDVNSLIKKMFEAGYLDAIANNLEALLEAGGKIDVNGLLDELIAKEYRYTIATETLAFLHAGASAEKLIKYLTSTCEHYHIDDNLCDFMKAGLSAKELVRIFLDSECRDYLMNYGLPIILRVCSGEDADEVAKIIIESNCDCYVTDNIELFLKAGGDAVKLVEYYVNAGKLWVVRDNLAQFLDVEFLEVN